MTNRPTADAVQDGKAFSPDGAATHRLLAVISGGHEFLLRPGSVFGVYRISDEQLSAHVTSVSTPAGTTSVVSLAERLSEQFAFESTDVAGERTVIVFGQADRSSALRVRSVTRPVETASSRIHPLPALAHLAGGVSCLDSLALIPNSDPALPDNIRLVIDPLAVLGLRATRQSLASEPQRAVPRAATGSSRDENRMRNAALRGVGPKAEAEGRRHGQLLSFSPHHPLREACQFRLCLPMSAIAEVMLGSSITVLPSGDPLLIGYLLWRSRPVPVIDLSQAFGGPRTASVSPSECIGGRILIARTSCGRHVALPTESQIQTMTTPVTERVEFSEIADCPHLGAFPVESGMLVVPDLSRILGGAGSVRRRQREILQTPVPDPSISC